MSLPFVNMFVVTDFRDGKRYRVEAPSRLEAVALSNTTLGNCPHSVIEVVNEEILDVVFGVSDITVFPELSGANL